MEHCYCLILSVNTALIIYDIKIQYMIGGGYHPNTSLDAVSIQIYKLIYYLTPESNVFPINKGTHKL